MGRTALSGTHKRQIVGQRVFNAQRVAHFRAGVLIRDGVAELLAG